MLEPKPLFFSRYFLILAIIILCGFYYLPSHLWKKILTVVVFFPQLDVVTTVISSSFGIDFV